MLETIYEIMYTASDEICYSVYQMLQVAGLDQQTADYIINWIF